MRQTIDYGYVPERQREIHERLEAWARWVTPNRAWSTHPMWRACRSGWRQWHEPEIHVPINTLEAHETEKAVAALPDKHREAVRWHYVRRDNPMRAAQSLAVTKQGLADLVIDGRTMLVNRGF